MSMKEIERRLAVSRSSVSLWVRDIELTPEQHAGLVRRNPAYTGQLKGSNANKERARLRRRSYQLSGRRRVRQPDALYVAGCMLFWAEETSAAGAVRFSNSDPEAIRLFARFRECFCVTDDRIRVYCHLFADHVSKQQEIEQFWLDVVGVPRTALRKSMVNNYSRLSRRKRVNRLPYGTCKLVVHSTEIVQTIYGSIQEYAGFSRPAWLDC